METIIARLSEVTAVIYCIGLIFLSFDFIQMRPKSRRIGIGILTFVWVALTAQMILQFINTDRLPVLSAVQSLLFFVWILVTFSLIANRFMKIDFLLFFTNIIGCVLMVIYTFTDLSNTVGEGLAERLISELLIVHITFAIISYGAFAIAFVLSVLYLVQYRMLKQKKWGVRLQRLGDLNKLEKMTSNLVVIGVPFLLVSLMHGLLWAHMKIPDIMWADPKIIGSIILLINYTIYIYFQKIRKFHGKTLAIWNVVCFIIVLINFLVLNNLSKFHIWG